MVNGKMKDTARPHSPISSEIIYSLSPKYRPRLSYLWVFLWALFFFKHFPLLNAQLPAPLL